MDNYSGFTIEGDEEQIELHPGFRFHPTDEELITYYLAPKVLDSRFRALAIGEADLNKVEPWNLPGIAKMGEEEWYFFCVRDKKYPTGTRTNRATESGYWKATGKDKEIYRGKSLVGMKKTLVFYRGRAPKGTKTNWVIHEFRLEGKYPKLNLPKTAKNEWVISRVFNKSSAGKRTHISALVGLNSHVDDDDEVLQEPSLPPLTDFSPHNSVFERKPIVESTPLAENTDHFVDYNNCNTQINPFISNDPPASSSTLPYCPYDLQCSDYFCTQDESNLKFVLDGIGNDSLSGYATSSRAEQSQDTGLSCGGDIITDMSVDGPIDLDCLLNY